MSKNSQQIVEKLCEEWTEEQKAKFAAIILSEIDPTFDNLATFMMNLEGGVKGELIIRCQDGEYDQ